MDHTIIAALIGVIGGLLGAWIGGIISRKASREAVESSNQNAIDIMRGQERIQNVASLCAAFAPTLSFIYLAKKHGSTHEIPDVDKFIRDSLLNQATAIELFRPFVSESDSDTYQEAWEKYRYEVWNYGFDTTTFRTDVDDPWKVFEDLIHNILHFINDKS
jgi:hypothetical protein